MFVGLCPWEVSFFRALIIMCLFPHRYTNASFGMSDRCSVVRPDVPFQSSGGFESEVVCVRFGSFDCNSVSSSCAKISSLFLHPKITSTCCWGLVAANLYSMDKKGAMPVVVATYTIFSGSSSGSVIRPLGVSHVSVSPALQFLKYGDA